MKLHLELVPAKHAVAIGSEPGRPDHGIVSPELAEWIRVVQETLELDAVGIEFGKELEESCEVEL